MNTAPEPTGKSERTAAPEGARGGDLRDPRLYINRELSWLEFNQRVLDEAADASLPVLDRIKFLGISSSNLDEFFMIRVAGLKGQIAAGHAAELGADAMTAAEQLRAVTARVQRMVADQQRLWKHQLEPQLARELGVRIARFRELTPEQRAAARDHFRRLVVPVLIPLANDRTHPFPQLRNKSITLAVHLPRPGPRRRKKIGGAMAVVGMPATMRRLVPVPDGPEKIYVLLEDLVAEHAGELFPGNPEVKTLAFRLTRNWDISVDFEEIEDAWALVKAFREEVRGRDRGAPVRLEFAADGFKDLTGPLADQLGLGPDDVYSIDGLLQVQDVYTIADELAPPRVALAPPAEPRVLREYDSIFDAVAAHDILLHHPYDSFEPVLDFLEEAADDPEVGAIRQVLYRIGRDSPFVKALVRAAENGKNVAVFLEIRARFDEDNNMRSIRELNDAGASVILGYGFKREKTHCKVTLVTRREANAMRQYVHVGTGNYNPFTARMYTDVSLLTARPDIGEDVRLLFNMLTANSQANDYRSAATASQPWPWKRIAVAPHSLKERTLELIGEENDVARHGAPARVLAKMNSLVDRDVIRALYAASQAGVRVDLLVRGICCLRPGVPGVSERIRVHQVVDRYLEHSRIFVFGEGKRAKVFISSGDWMPRNLQNRVEVMVPVDDPALRARLTEIVETGFGDTVKGSALRADGTYERLRPLDGEAPVRSQDALDPARKAANAPELRALPQS
ncbi:MAG TPA: polyphosphate kinase 1 [Anaeromyxobacteraceae bacterium]|nr:polyphosphate kinase 1 [Anaeromyxobacteraceae bacterium]